MGQVVATNQDAEIDHQLSELLRRSTKELRVQWRELHGRAPPSSFGRNLLRRSIAYKIQELAYGGLSIDVRQELDQLVRNFSKDPTQSYEPARRIKPGSVLVREWREKTYRVTVEASGFSYEGEAYSNLSEIARKITGTQWNGPRFFGLRKSTGIQQSSTFPRLKPGRRAR